MVRRNKILLIILAIFIALIAFLSFGFQTSNFNDLIQKKFNDQYKKIKLEFKDTRVSLDIKDFAVKFSLNEPKIYHKGDLTNIYQTNFGVDIISAIKGNYNPKFIEVKFSENSFEKSINLIRDVFLEDNQKSYFDNKVKKGFIKGDLKIYNEDIVKIEFLGSIKDTSLLISNELPELQNINAEIEFKNKELNVNISSGSAAGLNFDKSKISVNETSDSYKASLDLNLNGKFNSLKEFKNLKIAALEDITKNIEKLSFSTAANNKIDLELIKKETLLTPL